MVAKKRIVAKFKDVKKAFGGEDAPAPTPEVSSVTLESLDAKLSQLLSLVAPAESDIEMAKEKKGAPEGTESAGSGEGDVKLPKEDIAEKTHENVTATDANQDSAGENVKLEKSTDLAKFKEEVTKSFSEIKDVLKSFSAEKSVTGRPTPGAANNPAEVKKSTEDFALAVARGEKTLKFGEISKQMEDKDKEKVLEAIKG